MRLLGGHGGRAHATEQRRAKHVGLDRDRSTGPVQTRARATLGCPLFYEPDITFTTN